MRFLLLRASGTTQATRLPDAQTCHESLGCGRQPPRSPARHSVNRAPTAEVLPPTTATLYPFVAAVSPAVTPIPELADTPAGDGMPLPQPFRNFHSKLYSLPFTPSAQW